MTPKFSDFRLAETCPKSAERWRYSLVCVLWNWGHAWSCKSCGWSVLVLGGAAVDRVVRCPMHSFTTFQPSPCLMPIRSWYRLKIFKLHSHTPSYSIQSYTPTRLYHAPNLWIQGFLVDSSSTSVDQKMVDFWAMAWHPKSSLNEVIGRVLWEIQLLRSPPQQRRHRDLQGDRAYADAPLLPRPARAMHGERRCFCGLDRGPVPFSRTDGCDAGLVWTGWEQRSNHQIPWVIIIFHHFPSFSIIFHINLQWLSQLFEQACFLCYFPSPYFPSSQTLAKPISTQRSDADGQTLRRMPGLRRRRADRSFFSLCSSGSKCHGSTDAQQRGIPVYLGWWVNMVVYTNRLKIVIVHTVGIIIYIIYILYILYIIYIYIIYIIYIYYIYI